MFHAVLICSENECTEVFEAYGTLEELEALACDCGCALHVLSVSDAPDPAAAHGREPAFDLIPVA
jgi:hypothetical protein